MNDTSREFILDKLRNMLEKNDFPDAGTQPPEISFPGNEGGADRFLSELTQLSGTGMLMETPEAAVEQVVEILQEKCLSQLMVWPTLMNELPQLSDRLNADGIEVITGGNLDTLAGIRVGLTGALAAIADSGTLVVQNTVGQPVETSLLPDIHIALFPEKSVFPNLQAWLDSLPDPKTVISQSSNLVLITGPSRTADIELTITLGVHGPREVIVLLYKI